MDTDSVETNPTEPAAPAVPPPAEPPREAREDFRAAVIAVARKLDSCLLRDRRGLGESLQRLREAKDTPRTRAELARVERRIEQSRQFLARRLERRPACEYPAELPVSERREEIAAAIGANRVTIIAGETGSGKTTQLPKICLELGRGAAGQIGVTQPRRIAALGVAERVAQELGSAVGDLVGYQIRFEARTSPLTLVKFMTDGVLLAETRADRWLEAYDTLIIDEAHERNLNVDFLLGYIKRLLPRRPDLKLIVSSATLDVARFSAFFGDAPVVEVSGRTYPVEIRHRPPAEEDSDLPGLVAAALAELDGETAGPAAGRGDALVFLPGEQDIRETAELLTGRALPDTEILPLFGRLSAGEQRKVFQTSRRRRIVLATNVAETSVTVPRIRYVIDSGLARINRFDQRTQVERLRVESISQASAAQRAGRCGRVGPGICVRLYAADDLESRPEFTDPEIKRSSLASVILQMKELRLGEVEAFPFLEPPAPGQIKRGYEELFELGALDAERQLTPAGQRMARLPLEPRYARILLTAAELGVLPEALVIVAGLSVQDPRERPFAQRAAADAAHRRFRDPQSDFAGWLHLWRFCDDAAAERPSNNQFRRFCQEHFLSYRRLREWRAVREQLAEMLADLPAGPTVTGTVRNQNLHRALLAGLLSRLGQQTDKKDYQGAHGARFHIFPASGLFKTRPAWVFAAELVETKRLYAREAAAVDPTWAEALAPHLCKYSYADPHWDGRMGRAVAFEQVTIFGLPIVTRRRVDYGRVAPAAARKLLIEHGLVGGDLQTKLEFLEHNLRLVTEVHDWEQKARRTDLLVDKAALCAFYDSRLPDEAVSLRTLEKWFSRAARREPTLLHLRREDVLLQTLSGLTDADFPPYWIQGALKLPLNYRFAPGAADDGVTCTVPVGVLPQLDDWRTEWLVPGLLAEKVALLLRSLPRTLRRECNPIPETVSELLPRLEFGARPLREALGESLLELRGLRVPLDAWRPEELPAFLQLNYRIVDAAGETLAEGRDLNELRARLGQKAKEDFKRAPKQNWECQGLTDWPDGDLPERVELTSGGLACHGFPALVDQGTSVAVKIFPAPEPARLTHRAGFVRLGLLALGEKPAGIRRGLPLGQAALLFYSALGGKTEPLRDDLVFAAAAQLFLADRPPARDETAFREILRAQGHKLALTAYELGRTVDQALTTAAGLHSRLNAPVAPGPLVAAAQAEIVRQLAELVYPGFARDHGAENLAALPRYLEAIRMRLERLRQNPGKDRTKAELIEPLYAEFRRRRETLPAIIRCGDEFGRYRWMLEEYRVSIYAQEVGASGPISPKRLAEQWARVEAQIRQLPGGKT